MPDERSADPAQGQTSDPAAAALEHAHGGAVAQPVDPAPQGADNGEGGPRPWYAQLGYESEEKGVEGVRNLRNYAAEQHTAATAVGNRLAALEGRMSPAAQAADRGDPLAELEQYALPRDVMARAIDARVRSGVEDILRPLAAAAQAEQELQATYGPTYLSLKPEIDAFVDANPRVRQVVEQALQGGRPDLAAQFKTAKFFESRAFSRERAIAAQAESAKGERAQARRDAGIVAPRSDTRDMGAARQNGPTPDERANALTAYQAGDSREFERLFVLPSLPPQEEFNKLIGQYG